MTGRPALDGVAELVAVMDRLRSPGGCPWDREQSHATLVPYAVEEAHELVEAVETGTRDDLLEELGDVLLQVVFHARIAQEHPEAPFDLDAVARRTARKLVSRHPHVFGDADASDAEEVTARWDEIKRAEQGRESALDGVPPSLGAVARAAKLASRARRAGLPLQPDDGASGTGGVSRSGGGAPRSDDGGLPGSGDDVPHVGQGADGGYGERLLRLVLDAVAAGADPESELRVATRRWERAVRQSERTARAGAPGREEGDTPRS